MYQPNDPIVVAEDMTLYAIWAELLHVTYDASGADAPIERAVTFSMEYMGLLQFADTTDMLSQGEGVCVVFSEGVGGTLPSNIVEGTVYRCTFDSVSDLYYVLDINNSYLTWVDNGSGYLLGTTGAVPTDPTAYTPNAMASVLGQGGLVRSGFAFTGWNTVQGGGGTAYQPSDTFQVAADTTLYAVWSQ